MPDWEDLDDWAWHFPQANVGVVTGAVSRLVVVETDPKRGGREALARLQQLHGQLPRTVTAMTGDGGLQLYFAHPGGVVSCVKEVAPGVSISGDGGYSVAPPSAVGSGACRAWLHGRAPDDLPLAPLPAWMCALASERGDEHGSREHDPSEARAHATRAAQRPRHSAPSARAICPIPTS